MAKHALHSLRPDPANLPASSPLTDVPSHANDPRVAGGAALLEAVYPGGVREPGDPVSLSSGMRLRSCEILAGIGAGGMGEVYRASDPDRMATDSRSREAKVLAFLNRPIMAAIYGVQDGRS